MKSTWRFLVMISALLLASAGLSACGDDTEPADADAGQSGDGDGDGDAGDGDGDADGDAGDPDGFLAPRGDGWLSLIEGDWELPESEEGYRCVRFTIPEDTYMSGFKPMIPLGTHHTVLTIAGPDEVAEHEPDGIEECDAFTNANKQIAGSGVGTEAVEFPEGIATKLAAGSQLLLNLHLFNAGEGTLAGRSGIWIKTVDEAEVEILSDSVLAGSIDLQIPPGEITTEVGTCTLAKAATIFGVVPHMHQLGVHMKVVANSSLDGDVVLYDDAYSFDEQKILLIDDMVEMAEGDEIQVECTYDNDRDELVEFGDSSLAEMCFAGIMRFPPGAPGTACVN